MKKLSFLMFLLAVCGLLLSCSSSSPEIEKEDLLRKEVFAIK